MPCWSGWGSWTRSIVLSPPEVERRGWWRCSNSPGSLWSSEMSDWCNTWSLAVTITTHPPPTSFSCCWSTPSGCVRSFCAQAHSTDKPLPGSIEPSIMASRIIFISTQYNRAPLGGVTYNIKFKCGIRFISISTVTQQTQFYARFYCETYSRPISVSAHIALVMWFVPQIMACHVWLHRVRKY